MGLGELPVGSEPLDIGADSLSLLLGGRAGLQAVQERVDERVAGPAVQVRGYVGGDGAQAVDAVDVGVEPAQVLVCGAVGELGSAGGDVGDGPVGEGVGKAVADE